ncbi:MAG TPA: peptidase M61 [Acidobacteriaceae bacterium]|jgi:predicted metalloprotease with PDZ domain|nr:peptidase M61 [Acidobacteriaceae bacterium]
MRFSRPGYAAAIVAAFSIVLTPAAFSQNSPGPQPVPLPPPIVAPADTAYPGTIDLLVNLTDDTRGIVGVHETIPVTPGSHLTLLYPQWIPGNHSPTGPISKLGGLVVTDQGKRVNWVRDRVNVYAFHIHVPQGASKLDVDFQYLSPLRGREGRIRFTTEMVDLSWNTALLYPAGHFSRRITFSPSVKLPEGWKFATALETSAQDGNLIHFKDTTLNTLVDSPLYAGLYSKRLDLSTDSSNQVHLDVFADQPSDLAITPEELQAHRNLVEQAAKLFQSHHYSHYDFLLSISKKVGGEGLEHHQSSEDGTDANYFTDWAAGVDESDLLAHEYTHSWNGKFRRPADLWTPNFNVPMQDDLLWVYEGLTQYYGYVLTARSGMRTPAQTRDLMAEIAAYFDISQGRTWRPLVDTTNQPTISQRSPVTWVSWQRSEDYYDEGLLIWLDADTKIREMSGGQKSLDDFARLFYGIDNGSYITKTYTFDDIVAALNKVQPYDWATFLRTRVYELAPHTPEDGFTRGGYRLSYSDTAPAWLKAAEAASPRRGISFATSLGFSVGKGGALGNVWWNSVAFKAGITPNMQLLAVNSETYTADRLRAAIVAAEKSKDPIKLLMKRGDTILSFDLDYHDGLRYPSLERVNGTPDRLDAILAPLK